MMVPYKKSTEYEELAGIAFSKDKPYLKTLLEEKIGALEQGIAYVNYEHCTSPPTQPNSTTKPARAARAWQTRSAESSKNST